MTRFNTTVRLADYAKILDTLRHAQVRTGLRAGQADSVPANRQWGKDWGLRLRFLCEVCGRPQGAGGNKVARYL